MGDQLLYSNIVIDYYQIGLTPEQANLVDAHFYAAAHHFYRYKESGDSYHKEYYFKHLKFFLLVVSQGDFLRAVDMTGRGLYRSQGWTPLRLPRGIPSDIKAYDRFLPDDDLFQDMDPNPHFGVGQPFDYDHLCDSSEIVNIAAASF